MTRRRLGQAAVVAVFALVAAACNGPSPAATDPHSSQARTIAGIWWLMFGLAIAVYVIVGGLIVYAILHRPDKQPGFGDNGFILFGGIVIPSLILLLLAVVTVRGTVDLTAEAKGPLRVEVVGKQWWWSVRYPGTGIRTANEIHVPTGRTVSIRLLSDNVIHSFWVPQLNGKVDMIPGQPNTIDLTVSRPGIYRGQCAEFCGTQHARMALFVIADTPTEFARWVAEHGRVPGPPTSDLAAQGQVVFQREACAGCHTIRGTQATGTLGPDLSFVGGRRWIASFDYRNTPQNLAAWVTDAPSVKPGVLMPPMDLSPADLRAVVAYLESLK